MEILRLGSTGPEVELLQSTLKKLGFYTGIIDGDFGKLTENAVRRFQSNFGLTPDGIVGQSTWDRLYPYIYGYSIYRVRSGDSLFSIARRFGTSVNRILVANPNIDPNSLQINQVIIVPFGNVIQTDISYTYDNLIRNISGLSRIYPFLEIGSIGRSVLGRPIPVIRIGEGQKEVFYNASIHANEWITTPVLMKFLEEYSRRYVEDSSIFGYNARDLYENVTLYIVPMINPDGVDLVTGAIREGDVAYEQARQIANDYPDISFPSGWKANIQGIDLNLQFPAGWENAREIKFEQGFVSPAPRDYVGEGPLVAQEALAIYNFTLMHNFRLILTYHTQGRVIYWRFLNFLPPDSFEIGQEFSRVSGYELETTPISSGFAGYKDWFIQEFNKPGYTIEAGLRRKPSSNITI